MANEEQLSILKQGVDVWNRWRDGNSNVEIDLAMASLKKANLYKVNLREADLRLSNLNGADISGADIREAFLREANLTSTDLRRADFSMANLVGANLRGADLREANLRGADLMGADLREVDLGGANFRATNLQESNFGRAVVFMTIFGDLDMSQIIGLEDVIHRGPSTIGTNTIAKSSGKIPEVFLRGCGMSDWEIENVKLYNPKLSNDERNNILYGVYDLQASQAIQISPLFISYSHADAKFVDKLENQLSEKGVRFWRDVHNLKSGRMEKQIDRAIRQNPTVLLVLSENSLSSDWVEHEVHTARGLEKEMRRDVLCPVALDNSWKSSQWPARVMEQIMEYHILDFSEWQDDIRFEGMFRKLIDGLELFYKG
jgi:uncharacterized protein YjbI with pentapeptide repeats